MRILCAMLRRLPAGILALVCLLCLVSPAAADTGTYRILNYAVILEPQSDGQVKMTFNQTWEVTGGNIPWITVGLPNEHFSILDYSGAADSIKAEKSDGFSGVRIDLDQRYLAGDSFSLQFSVLQLNLLERLTDEKSWRINYTPGWYDRAEIDTLQIKLISPVETDTYTVISPEPLSRETHTVTWRRSGLSPGDRFKISLKSTDGSFLTASTAAETPPTRSLFSPVFFIIIGVIAGIGLLIMLVLNRYRKNQEAVLQKRIESYEKDMAKDESKKAEIESGFQEYVEKQGIKADQDGRYYDRQYGNYITPAIWAATIFYQQQRLNAQAERSATIGSRSCVSSSCACVSCACACACACAGGGAAGCAKKTLHECPQCRAPGEKK